MTTKNSDVVAANEDGRWYTVPRLCRVLGISTSHYYKIRRDGNGPEELRIPGSNVVRISAKAVCDWQARMAELAQQEAAQIEQARRVKQRREAGEAAAKSPIFRRPSRNRDGIVS